MKRILFHTYETECFGGYETELLLLSCFQLVSELELELLQQSDNIGKQLATRD